MAAGYQFALIRSKGDSTSGSERKEGEEEERGDEPRR